MPKPQEVCTVDEDEIHEISAEISELLCDLMTKASKLIGTDTMALVVIVNLAWHVGEYEGDWKWLLDMLKWELNAFAENHPLLNIKPLGNS